jgi:hypothetical protein
VGAACDGAAAQEEEVLRRRFRAKGLPLVLKEEMSAVNKKIDVRLKVPRAPTPVGRNPGARGGGSLTPAPA